MAKCYYCNEQAEGTLVVYYHDGAGVLAVYQLCADHGGACHDPYPYQPEGDDSDPRPAVYLLGVPYRRSQDVGGDHQYRDRVCPASEED